MIRVFDYLPELDTFVIEDLEERIERVQKEF